jgi:hypothetical protein
VEKLVDEMQKMGFLELADEKSGLHKVVAAYSYLEEMVNLITIDASDEISQ